MEKAPYSPDDLESIIDSFRFSGNWDAVLRALERYAQVFDIGAASASRQHWSSEDARCFYWSVMSEAMLEYRGSYEQALMCVKKAAGYNASYPDWRIFLCRILLENSSSQSNDRGDLPDCEPAEVLAEALQSFERRDSDFLLHSIRIMPKRFQGILLNVFSVIPSTEAIFICQHLLAVMNTCDDISQHRSCTPQQWSFVSCRFILRQLTLEGMQHSYMRGSMSDYRLWLNADAVVTRSILNELLGDSTLSRADILHVLHEFSPSSIPTAAGAVPGSRVEALDGGPGSMIKLPGPVRRLLLYSAARLPLLEKSMGLAQESYKSFRHCIGADSVYRSYFPPLLLLGLHIDAAVVILRFAAGIKSGITKQSADGDRESLDVAMSSLRESIDKPVGHEGSLADDVNLESALLLLRSCHEALSSNSSLLTDAKARGVTTGQFVDIELSWGASVAHNFAESELSIDFLPQSMGRRLPKPLSDPSQLCSIVSTSRVAYLMAGIVTKIFRGTDQSSRRESLTSTESFELLQWGFSNETTPPLNAVWALACCYLRLPISASTAGPRQNEAAELDSPEIPISGNRPSTGVAQQKIDEDEPGSNRSYVLPNFFGGEEVDATLELLDQCIAIILQRSGKDESPPSRTDNEIKYDTVQYHVLNTSGFDSIIHGVDYPELSLWFGLGHQPSRHRWLPFSLAAELCLNMLEDGPRSLHYAGNGLKSLFDSFPGCNACVQLLCFSGNGAKDNVNVANGIARTASIVSMLLDPNGHKAPVAPASCAEGYINHNVFSDESDTEVVLFLTGQLNCSNASGALKLYYTAARAHACWGRNSCLLVPERLFHRRVALKALNLMMRSVNIDIDVEGNVTVGSLPSSYTAVISTESVLLEYCTLMGEIGEIGRAILIAQSASAVFSQCGELHHLISVLLDSTSAEAINTYIHESSYTECLRALAFAKNVGVWSMLNCKLTLVNILWKFKEREHALREVDEILSELHRLTVTGELLSFSPSDVSNSFHSINRRYSRYNRACFIIEILLTAASCFREVQNTERSKACIEDAWRLLFASRDIMSGAGSGGGGGGMLWGNCFEEQPRSSWSMANSLAADISESSKMGAINENAAQVLHNHTYWLDSLRTVPTFEGWRLCEASGWGVDSVQRRVCLSLVALETASILRKDAQEKAEAMCRLLNVAAKRKIAKKTLDVDALKHAQECDMLKSHAIEFTSIALSIDPRNTKVLKEASRLQLDLLSESEAALKYADSTNNSQTFMSPFGPLNAERITNTEFDVGYEFIGTCDAQDMFDVSENFSENSRVHKAMVLAGMALEYDDVDFEAWFLLGESFERSGHIAQAAECYTRALERSNFSPSRNYACTLY